MGATYTVKKRKMLSNMIRAQFLSILLYGIF